MKVMTKDERKAWIIKNVPLLLVDDFYYELSKVREHDDRYYIKVLERLLIRIKNNKIQSEEHYARLQREHEQERPT